MFLRHCLIAFGLAVLLACTGCSGGNDPVNANKDRPVNPKAEKEK